MNVSITEADPRSLSVNDVRRHVEHALTINRNEDGTGVVMPPQTGPLVLRVRWLYKIAGATEPDLNHTPDLGTGAVLVLAALDGLAFESASQVIALHSSKERANVEGVHLSW